MPNSKNYPKTFNIHSKPLFYASKPKADLEEHEEISRTEIFDGDELFFEPNKRYFFDKDYDGDDSCDYYLVEKEIRIRPNLNYEKELERYNKSKEKFDLELEEWNRLSKQWKEEEAQEKEANELRIYQELKKKFEKP